MSSKEKSSAVAESGAALVPKLRFPEFEGSDGWKEIPLQKLARPVTDRATTGDADKVLSLSGEHGLVLQSEYFGKKIAGDSTDRYLKIRKNDFVYNDRTTKASSFGTIKRLSAHAGGIVSPIYKCFRFQSSENPSFWEWYFESGSHDPALGGLVNEGARAGRFNISVTQFLSTNAWRPDEAEQQKIADCLDSADALITAQGQKVEALRAHKKGLMQQLFPQPGETQPRLRFSEFEGGGDWDLTSIGRLGDVITGSTPSTARPEYYGGDRMFVSPGDISGDQFIDKTKTTLTALGFKETRPIRANSTLFVCIGSTIGKIAQNRHECATNQQINSVSPYSSNVDNFVYYALSGMAEEVANLAGIQAVPIVNKSLFSSVELLIPKRPEQQRIADCLTSLDDLIAAETRKLETLKTHKKGLMQQLFPTIEEFKP